MGSWQSGSDQSSKVDAFGRQRTSEPLTLFDSKQVFDNQPLFWDETTGLADISSAHSVSTASTVISYNGGETGGTFIRQTFMRFNYQPGKSQLVMMTGILRKTGAANTRIGYFDADNGMFFESLAGDTAVVLRSGASGFTEDTRFEQTDWNVDKMNGSGESGINLDWTKTQIFVFDFEWLGVGTARMGVFAHGEIHYVHEFDNANVLTGVYMSTPNLPCRFELTADPESVAASMECICGTVVSEGGASELGVNRYKGTGGAHVDTSAIDTVYAIVGIRLKSTHLGAEVRLLSAHLAELAGGKVIEWQLRLNPTVAGTFTFSGETNSSVETALGAITNTVTGGLSIAGGFFASANRGGSEFREMDSELRLGSAIDGTRDILVLTARPVLGTNSDVEGSLSWKEQP